MENRYRTLAHSAASLLPRSLRPHASMHAAVIAFTAITSVLITYVIDAPPSSISAQG